MSERRIRVIFLFVLAAIALYFCWLIAAPFLKPILSAAVIAIVSAPLHRRVQRFVHRPNAAALFSTLLVILLMLLPAAWVTQVISEELRHVFQLLNQQLAQESGWPPHLSRLGERLSRWLNRLSDGTHVNWRASLSAQLERLSTQFVSGAAGFVTNLASFIVQTVMAVVMLFFFLRDGRKMWERGAALFPMQPRQAEQLASSVSETVIASVYGVFAVGLAQGALTSLAFWVLNLPSPLLWGVIAAFFSLVPLVGSGAIWLPASLILLASGDWGKGLILLGWGIGVVAMADNVVRPLVLSESTKMHGLQTFIALLGGLQAFGLIGLFIGPVVLAVTKAIFQILHEESRDWRNTFQPATAGPDT